MELRRIGGTKASLTVKKYSDSSESANKDEHSAEIRRLKRELARVTEERDILKKATVYFAREAK